MAAVLMSACAQQPPGFVPATSGLCKAADNDADCTILVDVAANPQGTNCTVKVLDSQFTVGFKRDAAEKWIRWEISGSSLEGARFARNGIDPKPPQANIDAWMLNFKNGGADHGGRQFKWKNDNGPNQVARSYEYLVAVQVPRPGGATWDCKQDPVIRN
jgi:hypothetical protein